MEQIEYTRTVVPSSMRSPYWKYFGFPSDNGNNILTRQKIVCTICNTAIAYNKNSSNLRTHLMAKHVEIFQNLLASNGALATNKDVNNFPNIGEECRSEGVEIKKPGNNIVSVTKLKRRHSELREEATIVDLQPKNELCVNQQIPKTYLTILQSTNNATRQDASSAQDVNHQELVIHNSNYSSFEDLNNSEIVEDAESNEGVSLTDDALNATDTQPSFTYVDDVIQQHPTIEIAPSQEQTQQHSLENMMADMIQNDLLSLDFLKSPGFSKYNQQLTGLALDSQTIQRVVDILRQRFINTQQLINNHATQLSQITAYSLSLEYYKDNDQQMILNIYFNYLNDEQMELNSCLYFSGKHCNAVNALENILKEINLKNCCALVVPVQNKMEEFIQIFAKCHDIVIVECLESMLTRCLNEIFRMDEFNIDFQNLCNDIENQIWLLHTKPTFKPQCCWSKLNYLQYMLNNLDEHQKQNHLEMEKTLDYIKPLKMALDIITDEPLPLCTLTRPLIIKLFEEHFSFSNREKTHRLTEIQKILERELKETVLTLQYLNETTFFDARFHCDFALEESVFDINHLKSKVCERFANILDVHSIIIKTENKSLSLLRNSKKSSLKTFFKRDSTLSDCTAAVKLKTNLDVEFENYQKESSLDLDQNPVLWWQQYSNKYKELQKIAKYYLSIPCCSVPRLYRLDLEQRNIKLERRKQLNQFCNIERNLWYLYYNDLAVAEIKF